MKYDMHIHSKYSSDGIMDVKEIVKIAIKRGLDGIAITDHNTIKGGIEAKKYEIDSLKVIIGSEIMTEKGEVIGLFLSEEIRSGMFQDVINDIRDQNGIIIIPHPFDEMRHSSFQPAEEDIKFIDCIEGFNSRCLFQKYNKNAKEFAKRHNMAITAGSDAHFINEIANAGVITEIEDIREAFLKKEIEIFGKRSSFINHGLTKGLKLWRKTNSSI
ncbi:Error-prone DNA polymerase [uncultured archaeon]|nr:Error-prone DNA polymerase [uncultured archaeon]